MPIEGSKASVKNRYRIFLRWKKDSAPRLWSWLLSKWSICVLFGIPRGIDLTPWHLTLGPWNAVLGKQWAHSTGQGELSGNWRAIRMIMWITYSCIMECYISFTHLVPMQGTSTFSTLYFQIDASIGHRGTYTPDFTDSTDKCRPVSSGALIFFFFFLPLSLICVKKTWNYRWKYCMHAQADFL